MSPVDSQPPPSFPPSPSPPRTAYVPPSLRWARGGDSSLPNKGGDPHKDENVRVPVQENRRDPLKDGQKKPVVSAEWCHPLCLLVENHEMNKIPLTPEVRKMGLTARRGLMSRRKPTPTSEGTGGSYYMFDESGKTIVAIFKPIDEEPNAVNNPRGRQNVLLKRGAERVLGALREIGAYLLDHPKSGYRDGSKFEMGFSGVPLTIMVGCSDEAFHYSEGYKGGWESKKGGSLQMYMQNSGDCADIGLGLIDKLFPVEEVHKIAVLDLRIGNADRHAANILIGPNRDTLIPIDHGQTFPCSFEYITLVWLDWPQAKRPFSKETREYIKSLDAEKDVALLRSNGVKLLSGSMRTLRILTSFLKDGAARGLSPYDIGCLLCREIYDQASVIEKVVAQALTVAAEGPEFYNTVSNLLSAELDKISNKKKPPI